MKTNKNTLKIAVQKSGRLTDKAMDLFKIIWFDFDFQERKLFAKDLTWKIELIFLRNSDIPSYLEKWICDFAIVWENSLIEKWVDVKSLIKLWFWKCRFSIASPFSLKIKNFSDLNWKIIATSYPHSVQKFLDKNWISAQITEISWSTEIAPALELADLIADLVSTGSTLLANWLSENFKIFESESVLVKTNKKLNEEKNELIWKIILRIKSVILAKKSKYIVMNAEEKSLEKIKKLLPWLESPTITKLSWNWMISISSVVSEELFWEDIEKLKEAWASWILVMPIEKMII